MTTIDHFSLGVADGPSARDFYGRVLDILGIRYLAEGEGFAAFGLDLFAVLLLAPLGGGPATAGDGIHVAFAAPNRDAVAKAHAAGLDTGASDEGGPGARAAYPMPGVFAACLRDPRGNKIEPVHGGLSA